MINIIKSEFYKMFKLKGFWISFSIMFGITILMYLVELIGKNFPNLELAEYLSGAEIILSRLNGTGSFNILFLSIFMVYFFTLDNENGCIKNIFGRNINRSKYYLCKFLCCVIGTVLIYGLNMLSYMILGSIFYGFDTTNIFNFKGFLYLCFIQTVITITYISIFQFICVIIKKFGFAIVIIILFLLFEGLIPFSLGSFIRIFSSYDISFKSIMLSSLSLLIIIFVINLLGIKIMKKSNF